MEAATARAPDRLALHEIVDEVRELAIRLEEAGGELTPELEADLDRWEGALEEKAERIIRYQKQTEALAAAAKAESDRIRDIARTYSNRAASLKQLLEYQLQRLGRRDVETVVGKAYLQKNPPSCKLLVAPEDLPEGFRTLVPESWKADQRAVINAAKEGEDVSAFAVIEQTESLRIR